ncbi:MAG: hypothetical protein D6757_05150, partial [Alphaproteobacteria bacterium]
APNAAETAGVFGTTLFGARLGATALEGAEIGAELGSAAGPVGALLGGLGGAAFGIGVVLLTRAVL